MTISLTTGSSCAGRDEMKRQKMKKNEKVFKKDFRANRKRTFSTFWQKLISYDIKNLQAQCKKN